MAASKAKDFYMPIIRKVCKQSNVDAELLAAIIEHESVWDPYAVRFEEFAQNRTIPTQYAKDNNISISTERTLERFSWGLAQMMGYTLRDLGYRGPLTAMVEAERNITWAVKLLSRIYMQHPLTNDIIASWNHGSPERGKDGKYVGKVQEYVDKVLTIYKGNVL